MLLEAIRSQKYLLIRLSIVTFVSSLAVTSHILADVDLLYFNLFGENRIYILIWDYIFLMIFALGVLSSVVMIIANVGQHNLNKYQKDSAYSFLIVLAVIFIVYVFLD